MNLNLIYILIMTFSINVLSSTHIASVLIDSHNSIDNNKINNLQSRDEKNIIKSQKFNMDKVKYDINFDSILNDVHKTDQSSNDVDIDMQTVVSKTGPLFVGVTIDSSIFRNHWKNVGIHSRKFQSLIKGLSPAFLRMGGTAADFFIFDNSKHTQVEIGMQNETELFYKGQDNWKPQIKNYTVSVKDWDTLNYLVKMAGWNLIFDFNEFLRTDKGMWDSSNAKKLLKYSQIQNYSIPCFQIGNEPNSYYHNFNFTIPPNKLVSDMISLRKLLAKFKNYRNSCIVGPDVTKVTKESGHNYLKGFLSAGGAQLVSAATLHHYYFNAKDRGVSVKDFTNISILNTLKDELYIGTSTTHAFAPNLPIWLSETSSVSGGGLPGASNAFVAGFMWLDKLGMSALYGIQTVIRQTLMHGHYSLISADHFPYPDYFLTHLYKRLVQGNVFNVRTWNDHIRIYAGCANHQYYLNGALTVYMLNVQNKTTTLNLQQFSNHSYELYLLTPGDEKGLESAYAALNGKKLVMVDDKLPIFSPMKQKGPIHLPSYSFGFIVIPYANVEQCHENKS